MYEYNLPTSFDYKQGNYKIWFLIIQKKSTSQTFATLFINKYFYLCQFKIYNLTVHINDLYLILIYELFFINASYRFSSIKLKVVNNLIKYEYLCIWKYFNFTY